MYTNDARLPPQRLPEGRWAGRGGTGAIPLPPERLPLFAIEVGHRCDGRNLGRTYVHAGKRLGAVFPEVLVVEGLDLACLGLVARSDQVAIVCVKRAKEVVAVRVVGANLEAKPALQAFCNLVLEQLFARRRRLASRSAWLIRLYIILAVIPS